MIVKFIAIALVIIIGVSCKESKEERSKKHVNIAIRYNYQNKKDLVLEHLNKAIKLDSENVKAYYYKSVVYMDSKNYKRAIEILDSTIMMKPDYGEAYKQRALAKFYIHDKLGSCDDWLKADSLGVPNLDNRIRHCR